MQAFLNKPITNTFTTNTLAFDSSMLSQDVPAHHSKSCLNQAPVSLEFSASLHLASQQPKWIFVIGELSKADKHTLYQAPHVIGKCVQIKDAKQLSHFELTCKAIRAQTASLVISHSRYTPLQHTFLQQLAAQYGCDVLLKSLDDDQTLEQTATANHPHHCQLSSQATATKNRALRSQDLYSRRQFRTEHYDHGIQ